MSSEKESFRDWFWCCACCFRKPGYADLDNQERLKINTKKDLAYTNQRLESKIKELEAEKEKLNGRLEVEISAKEDAVRGKDEALQRLSEQIALRLADNNPNLADLSDINRPNNLAEKFSQLYDNEWTNAFEKLKQTEGFEEDKIAIKQLLDIVMESFRFCIEKSKTQLDLIVKAFDIDKDSVSLESRKLIKDARKKIAAVDSLPFIRKEVQNRLQELDSEFEEMVKDEAFQQYVDQCIALCWLMAVQDPPMAISIDAGEERRFAKTKFREYTKAGEAVDYFVWPCVLIQDGGSVMSKGVVQCRVPNAEETVKIESEIGM